MKQIYGIDLSKEKFDACFDDSGAMKWLEVKNTFKAICKFLTNIHQDAVIVAEYTGVYGDLLVFLANQFDIQICLETGYKIKHSLGLLKGKTDKLDAERIREYGMRFYDKLKPTFFDSEEIAELTELNNLRRQLVKERKMLLTHNEKKSQCVYNSVFSRKIMEEMLQSFNQQILKIEKEILKLIKQDSDLNENYEIVTSIQGVGPVTTAELIIKTKNFVKIDTAKKAASYAGVCPFPNKSGKMIGKSKVSHLSDKRLKTLLYMCAKTVVKHNKEYRLYYQKKKLEGKQHYLIMNNISNKLLRTIYTLVKSKQKWNPMHMIQDPRMATNNVA